MALAAVFAYHARAPWATGGFLGVDIFFVLSGYLITGLLLADWSTHGRIGLARFWRRRARRLLPPLGVVLAAAAVAVPVLAREQVGRLTADLAAAATYVSNWRLVAEHQSYFAASGRPPALQHLWSLAVEEQFYLLFPLVLAGALALGRWLGARSTRWLAGPLLTLAAGSALLMARLHVPYADPSRVYYGTDTRVAALLVGAALACLAWRWMSGPGATSAVASRALGTAGGLALLALLFVVATVEEFDPGLYRGGFLAVASLAAVVVAACAHPGRSWFSSALGWRPLAWLGQRSYAAYLWFWPVMVVTRPRLDLALEGWPLQALRVAITVGLAHATHELVERPVREGALERLWNRARRCARVWTRERAPGRAAGRAGPRLAAVTTVVTVVVAVGLAAAGAGVAVFRPGGFGSGQGQAVIARGAGGLAKTAWPPDLPAGGAGQAGETASSSAHPAAVALPDTPPVPAGPPTTAAPPPPAPASARVWAIGDSVMAGAKAPLEVNGVQVDAVVGRQFNDTLATARALRDAGALGEIVIVQTGNNGPISGGHVDALMEVLAGVSRVVWVSVSVDRSWQDHNNDVIAEGVGRWSPRAAEADWRAIASEHPEAVYNDGLHLTPAGRQLYTELLLRTIA